MALDKTRHPAFLSHSETNVKNNTEKLFLFYQMGREPKPQQYNVGTVARTWVHAQTANEHHLLVG